MPSMASYLKLVHSVCARANIVMSLIFQEKNFM